MDLVSIPPLYTLTHNATFCLHYFVIGPRLCNNCLTSEILTRSPPSFSLSPARHIRLSIVQAGCRLADGAGPRHNVK